MRPRWLVLLGALLVLIALLALAGWSRHEQSRVRQELDLAAQDMAEGRHARARQRLIPLSHSRTFQNEALFQIGLCEEVRGRFDAALSAWEQIPAGSRFSLKSIIARARIMVNTGQFSVAEALLAKVPRGQDPDGNQARQALELILRIQGRVPEVLPLILETWAGSHDPAAVLRRVYLLDNSAFPVDYVRTSLEAADRDDDRGWLGKAHLATWTGNFAEAKQWLDRCVVRRPQDAPVWRACLNLAIAASDPDSFRKAAEQLPTTEFTPVDLLRLRAWVARQGDSRDESDTLRSLVEQDPGNIGAWDRLGELALLAGQTQAAEGYRKRKAEMNAQRERYKNLIAGDDRAEHVEELEILAGRLGRRLEARGWSLIRQGQAASQQLSPEAIPALVSSVQGETLAAALSGLLSKVHARSPLVASSSTSPAPFFRDDAEAVGLRFVQANGHAGSKSPPPPETMCGGVAMLDYDGDGWLDVYVVQAGPFPPSGQITYEGDRLFRNRRDGTFEDVTQSAGISAMSRGYGHGVAVADYDNDGHPDLFVTRWRAYALYRNRGDGTFEDATIKAVLGGDRDWPTSAAFGDLDGDGDLDLYVCHYLHYDPSNPKRCEHPESPGRHDCDPLDFPSLPDHVFRNDGGRFVDVTAQAGFSDPDGRGLGVVAADLDDDGLTDLYVTNDMTANYLFRNLGSFRFEETGQLSGAAASADGGYKAGMGIACGDLDGDGRLDLAVTNYFGESTTFYRNLGQGFFADHTAAMGIAAPTRRLLGFGVAFLDVNNDGWLDLLSANGHILDNRPRFPWSMPLQLLLASPGGHMADVSEKSGSPFGPLHLGRGLAIGDLDNDGRLDALVVAQNEALIYLHNQTARPGHFIRFRMEGTRSNRDAVGARITISCADRRRVGQRIGGGSYQSSSDPRIHFGLGASTRIESLEVKWPSGKLEHHGRLGVDREYLLREGEPPILQSRP